MLKNIITVLSGSITGQLLALAALPILSRIYQAEAFGKLQFYLACLNVLLMVAAFRYEIALLSADDGKSYTNLLQVILRILIAVSIATGVAVLIAWSLDFSFLSGALLVFVLLVPATFIGGIYQTLTYLPMRFKNYGLSSRSKLVQSAAYVATAFSLCWTPIANESLIVADIVARGAGAIAILKGVPGTLRAALGRQTGAEFKETAKVFKRFPLFSFPGTLVSALTATIMPLILTRVFGFEVAGQYALVERFVLAPVAIIAGGAMQVFTGEFSTNVRVGDGNLNLVYRRIVRNLALIAIGPCLLGMAFATYLVPVIFGSGWVLAGKFCAIAMPIAFVNFVVMPVNMSIILCGRQKVQFAWEIFRSFLFAVVLVPLAWYDSILPETLMIAYTVAVAGAYAVFLVLADYVTRHPSAEQTIEIT
jgi:O-antigen/teichoic acid export membrane protein